MQRINSTVVRMMIGFVALGISAFAQQTPTPPQQQQGAPVSKEVRMARRQAMQRLVSDFSVAIKNGSLTADDAQKAESALTQLQPHGKGAPRDPQARHEAMKTVQQMSNNSAFRPEDRELLAKDLAALKPARQ